jgi:hypothetical protein
MNYHERERVQSRILTAANIVAITAHSGGTSFRRATVQRDGDAA